MGRTSIPEQVADLLTEMTYIPSPEQRRIKANFWSAHSDSPLAADSDITASYAIQLVGDARIQKWWSLPGFQAWFRNADEYRQRLEYLAQLALDAAEDILLDRDASPAARVHMAKLVIEAAGKMPSRTAGPAEPARDARAAARIGSLTKQQLLDYTRKLLASHGGD